MEQHQPALILNAALLAMPFTIAQIRDKLPLILLWEMLLAQILVHVVAVVIPPLVLFPWAAIQISTLTIADIVAAQAVAFPHQVFLQRATTAVEATFFL